MAVVASNHAISERTNFVLVLPTFILYNLNIWMHEAGHIYWSPLGKFFGSLGGTLNEILFPFLAFLWARKKCFFRASALSLYLIAFNLFGIAAYVADARARKLDLLGADSNGHDWGNILGTLGLLSYDASIALVISFLVFFWE